MATPTTKDAVNDLVTKAIDLLEDPVATDSDIYSYLFTIAYSNIGVRYPAKVMGRDTYIVPEQVSEAHEKITKIIKQYFSDIANLEGAEKILARREVTIKQLQELKL